MNKYKLIDYLSSEIENGNRYIKDKNVDELFKMQVKFQNEYLSGLLILIYAGCFDWMEDFLMKVHIETYDREKGRFYHYNMKIKFIRKYYCIIRL